MSEGRSGGRRAVEITARTAHLCAMAFLAGGHYFGAPHDALHRWGLATVATGVVLLATEAVHSRHWIYQARGVIALAHAALVAVVVLAPRAASAAIAATLVVGSVGSHLPRSVRKWSFRHREVVD